jgi:hypothetical protein
MRTAKELTKIYEAIRELVKSRRCTVVTATQPPSHGIGFLSPEEMAEVSNKPLFCDYINVFTPDSHEPSGASMNAQPMPIPLISIDMQHDFRPALAGTEE